MKRLLLVIPALALLVVSAHAQARTNGGFSDTFTFDGTSAITAWNGVVYPGDMGAVSLKTQFGGGSGSGIDIPILSFGYLNNGFLSPCDSINWDLIPKVWAIRGDGTTGDGTKVGDSYTQHASTTCPYFTGEWGAYHNSNNRLDGFSVDPIYVVVQSKQRICPRFHPCYYPLVTVLAGGSGTATDTIIN